MQQLLMIDNAVRGEVIERLLIDGFQWGFFFFTNRDPTLFFSQIATKLNRVPRFACLEKKGAGHSKIGIFQEYSP